MMKRFVRNMNPEERRAWRRWQSLWISVYVAVFGLLFGISSFLPGPPRDMEVAQSVLTAQAGR